MFFLKVMVVLLVAVVLGYLLDKKMRKWLRIEKRIGTTYVHVNSVHKWGERFIFLLIFLVITYVTFSSEPIIELEYVLFIFYPVFFGFRAWMEWKYTKKEKEYIMTIVTIGLFFLFILALVLLERIGYW